LINIHSVHSPKSISTVALAPAVLTIPDLG
jgi:hypothetical protein